MNNEIRLNETEPSKTTSPNSPDQEYLEKILEISSKQISDILNTPINVSPNIRN
ncbi:hypothetical protein KAI58_01820 [Candidatus Gracilibacteria bacterium]|nr:hypothetical protein [Candidatus Gracilibacteria bacterium]